MCFPSLSLSFSLSIYISLSLFPVGGYFQFVTDYLKHLHVIPLQTNFDIDLIETFLLVIIDRKKEERKREREKAFFLISSLCRNVILSFLHKFSTKDNIEKLARIPVFVKHQNVFTGLDLRDLFFNRNTDRRLSKWSLTSIRIWKKEITGPWMKKKSDFFSARTIDIYVSILPLKLLWTQSKYIKIKGKRKK